MTQQSGNQFDDLTVGNENDGSFSTDSIDLFEFSGGEESPIARLKTIILSIDWEINDDILQQLDDELVDLGEIWANDKIKQVYIQGLNKIGKYIYKEKASAHPNSIKLLLTFYHNLEKIVSSDDLMSDEEKKDILLEDVRKFDQLKLQIGETTPVEKQPVSEPAASAQDGSSEPLKDLKALVLGLDWEITDQGLQKLLKEVKRLEGVFLESKAKRILLQGIGAVGAYIDKMRSQSNGKSFPLLHSFCDALEKITLTEISPEEEKKLLLSEVEKFNAFKVEIAKAPSQDETDPAASSAPATKPPPEDAASKTEKNILADSLPVDHSDDEEQVSSDVNARLTSVFGGIDEADEIDVTDKDTALEGVNIETEADDDSDEVALPYENGAVAPALSDAEEESSFSVEKLAGDLAGVAEEEEPVESGQEIESVLPGVDVETEADDDSDEEALPVVDGEIAPALSGSFEDEGIAEAEEANPSEDLDNRLDSFFNDEVESSLSEWGGEEDGDEVTPGSDEGLVAAISEDAEGEVVEPVVELTSEADDEELVTEPSVVTEDEDFAPALASVDEIVAPVTGTVEEDVEEQLSMFDEDEPAGEAESVAGLSSEIPETEDTDEEDETEQLSPVVDLMEDELAEIDEIVEESPVVMTEESELEDSFLSDDLLADDEVPTSMSDSDEESEAQPVPALSGDDELFTDYEDEEESGDIQDGEVTEEPIVAAQDSVDDERDAAASDDETLSFLDDKIENDEDLDFSTPGVELEDSVTTEETEQPEEIDELFDSEEIEFTVPGEESSVTSVESDAEEESLPDDVIAFQVPGEVGDEIGGTGEIETPEVVFEAVGDEEEVDLLPGEEYLDSDESIPTEFMAQETPGFTPAVAETAIGVEAGQDAYDRLEMCIQSYKENSSNDTLDGLLSEVNSLRGSGSSDYTAKIYLQLISTVCQNCEQNPSGVSTENFSLMDEILVGLKMNSDAEVTINQGQEQLLRCTSQVLLARSIDRQTGTGKTDLNMEDVAFSDSMSNLTDDVQSSVSDQELIGKNSEESLKTFVQEELADIRKIFLDEISSLRREFKE